MDSLFPEPIPEASGPTTANHDSPLPARMRPRTLAEVAGQKHILGEGSLLRRAIEADRFSSLIFYGPPGTGKDAAAAIQSGADLSSIMGRLRNYDWQALGDL